MKIAFVLSQGIHYFYFDRVVRLLYTMGHEIKIVCQADFSSEGNKSSRALKKLLMDESGITLEGALPRKKYRYITELIRGLRDYSNFIRPEHPTPHLAVHWAGKTLSPRILNLIQLSIVKFILTTKAARVFLNILESLIPSEQEIVTWFRDFQPQIMFTSPYVFTSDIEVEYTKAAQSLNIPVISSLLSWDNLTSKGTYRVKPGWLFVWNQSLVEEAVQIHDFEPSRVFVTGAPVYDPWFDLSPTKNRELFCSELGLKTAKPYVLYLCSSKGISERETELLKELISHLENIEEQDRPTLVIRPHPFKDMDIDGLENEWVKAFPKGGQRPDTDQARSIYYDSLYHSAAVVGVNTTGFLEAAILDRPCLTLVSPMTSRGQEMRAHFKHLVEAGYIEVAKDFYELAEKTENVISGFDPGKENRAKFVRHFIRPHGLDVEASRVMAGAILAVAQGKKPDEWKSFDSSVS